jgi:putative ABC transport system substrate-binding protein
MEAKNPVVLRSCGHSLKRVALLFALVTAMASAALAADPPSRGKVHRVGFLGSASPSAYAPQIKALRQGFSDLGYVEGKNLVIEYRWAEGKYERLAALATELVRLKPDLLVTHGTPGTLAAKQATTTIPIVMAITGDAVLTGLVKSLARPGGNVTGSSFFFPELNAKRLEMLKETFPRLSRVAVLVNPNNPANVATLKAMEQTARSIKVQLQLVEVRGPDDFKGAFATIARGRAGAVSVYEDAMLIAQAGRVAELAGRARLASIGFREYSEAGGLMAFGVNFPDLWYRAATFADKIFKGARPGEIPVEQPLKYEVVVNLKTAKALGLTFPQSLLLRADLIIE